MEDNFHQLNQKLDALLSKSEGTDRRIDSLLVHMDERFDVLGKTVDELAIATKQGFDAVDERFDSMQTNFGELATAVKQGFDEMDDRFEAVEGHFVRVEAEVRDGFAQTNARARRFDIDQDITARRVIRLENAIGI